MTPTFTLSLALAALAIDALIGYPDWLFRLVGHPVTWIGRLVATLDRLFNHAVMAEPVRRGLGILAALFNISVAVIAAVGFAHAIGDLPAWAIFIATALAASTLSAARSLHVHVAAVRDAFRQGGLPAGRQAVSMIVGRNPDYLDTPGVCRAAIESLAESLSDGVVAPLFWMAVLGLPGAAAYKAVNTADSMIGHKTERHLAFGWAAARIDDLVNLPASRLSAYAIVLAAIATDGMSPRGALRAIRRDARRHKSPNAGWPEAAMAGALGLRLNGPKVYGEMRVDDAWMGDGRIDVTPADIGRALVLYRHAVGILALLALLLQLLLIMLLLG